MGALVETGQGGCLRLREVGAVLLRVGLGDVGFEIVVSSAA